MQKMATYSAEGKRMRDYSLAALLRLAGLRKVYFTFGSRGRLLHATFLPHDGSRLLKRTAYKGQKYSYSERVGDTHRAWKHADMLSPASIQSLVRRPLVAREIDLHIRAIFRAVPLSVMRREPEPPPPSQAKVVSIASARRKPATRVVAGERRAA